MAMKAAGSTTPASRAAPKPTAEISRARAGHRACLQAVLTHGGMGYAKEYQVERLLREVLVTHRAGERADDPVLHRRKGPRPAEVVLSIRRR